MTEPTDAAVPRSTSRLVWRTGLAVAVIALAVNLLIYVVARAAGSPLATQMAGRFTVSIGVWQIIPVTVFVIAVATLLLWQLRKRGRSIFAVLAYVGIGFALVSLSGPLALGATPGSKIGLALMHLTSGVVWAFLLLRARRVLPA